MSLKNYKLNMTVTHILQLRSRVRVPVQSPFQSFLSFCFLSAFFFTLNLSCLGHFFPVVLNGKKCPNQPEFTLNKQQQQI